MSNYLVVFNEHKDIVQDMSFNVFGNRLATCSCDQMVKVFDKRADGQWTCTHTWKVHCGPVWKIDWAHPCYGQVLATCSFDRTVLYRHCVLPVTRFLSVKKVSGGQNAEEKSWVKRASLVDSRCDVVDAKFSPSCLGLLLAAGARDGTIRIYEAVDLSNLAQWNLQHEIQASCHSLTSLAWCASENRRPMLAVGTDSVDPENPKLVLYTYKEDFNQVWDRVNCTIDPSHSVNDLKFAPSLGRTFYLLAVAGKTVQILSVHDAFTEFDESSERESLAGIRVKLVFEFTAGSIQFWRLCWNVTGTMLSAIASDGVVYIYHYSSSMRRSLLPSCDGKWQLATTVLPEGS
ncbi:nucleoporin SEH1 [Trichuris trichiura]|uniref:Nucleoporin SEH1 n=1 Tax=Trichuris trichiura TaxID=36087 RepID=A0A077Z1D4_TRITR|nr:nucleoporin SEH1 [Trichuris trichiura]